MDGSVTANMSYFALLDFGKINEFLVNSNWWLCFSVTPMSLPRYYIFSHNVTYVFFTINRALATYGNKLALISIKY